MLRIGLMLLLIHRRWLVVGIGIDLMRMRVGLVLIGRDRLRMYGCGSLLLIMSSPTLRCRRWRTGRIHGRWLLCGPWSWRARV